MSIETYPDIEIYLACADIARINAWLEAAINAPALQPQGKLRWRTRGSHQGRDIPVLLVSRAADEFSSLWIDSPASPWVTDSDCARGAASALGCEVRCSLGGWHPGDDPDRFLQLLPDGSENVIDWPDGDSH